MLILIHFWFLFVSPLLSLEKSPALISPKGLDLLLFAFIAFFLLTPFLSFSLSLSLSHTLSHSLPLSLSPSPPLSLPLPLPVIILISPVLVHTPHSPHSSLSLSFSFPTLFLCLSSLVYLLSHVIKNGSTQPLSLLLPLQTFIHVCYRARLITYSYKELQICFWNTKQWFPKLSAGKYMALLNNVMWFTYWSSHADRKCKIMPLVLCQ